MSGARPCPPALRQELTDGFYEWKAVPGQSRKVPYRFTLAGGGLFALAGIWEHRQGPEGGFDSCAILTTRPNELVGEVHNRMPVILRPELEAMWIDEPVTDLAALTEAFEPYPPSAMAAYAVSTRVNSTKVDDAECARPA